VIVERDRFVGTTRGQFLARRPTTRSASPAAA
jgi:hypothetical protein